MIRAYNLHTKNISVLSIEGKDISALQNDGLLDDLALLVDMRKVLHTDIQGCRQLISDMYHLVGTFHGKLEKWESEFEQGEAKKKTFPSLTGNLDVTKFGTIIRDLKEEFEGRFLDFINSKTRYA